MATSVFLRCHQGVEEEESANIELVAENSIIPRRPTVDELAIESVPEDYHCQVCKLVLRYATSASCGHIFCKECIEILTQKENPVCPECEDSIEHYVIPCLPIQKRVDKIKVHCDYGLSYRVKDQTFTASGWGKEGCPEILLLGVYNEHLQTCLHALIQCSYATDGCQSVIERRNLEEHKLTCLHRPYECECGLTIPLSSQGAHEGECGAKERPCLYAKDGCDSFVKPKDLEEHLETCPSGALVKINGFIAAKVVEECLVAAACKLARLQQSNGTETSAEEQTSIILKAVFPMFEVITKNFTKELRTSTENCLKTDVETMTKAAFGANVHPTSSVDNLKEKQREVLERLQSTKSLKEEEPQGEIRKFSLLELLFATDHFSHSIGRGMFGSVYKGTISTGQAVAVKKGDSRIVKALESKGRALQELNHPHIVLFIGCCVEAGCTVSEYVPGPSLEDWLFGRGLGRFSLTWNERIRLFFEMASALVYIHRKGFVHTGLKPTNVLLYQNGNIPGGWSSKLADVQQNKLFYESTSSHEGSQNSGFGQVNKPRQQHSREFWESSDVYDLGCITLQLLTHKPSKDDIHSILQACGLDSTDCNLERGNAVFLPYLDPAAGPADVGQVRTAVKLALQCVNSKESNRHNLETEIYPELEKLASSITIVAGQVSSENQKPQTMLDLKKSHSRVSSRLPSTHDGETASEQDAASDNTGIPLNLEQNENLDSLQHPSVATMDAPALKFLAAAQKGDPIAQRNLGDCYRLGNGTEQDYGQSFRWYDLAAKQGNAEAMFHVSMYHKKGYVGDVDLIEALRWCRAAARKGSTDAQWTLASYYYRGDGVPQNLQEAFQWYDKAAQEGHIPSRKMLAYCYKHGVGVNQSFEKSFYWYQLAAEQGDSDAQGEVGMCFKKGEGVTRDPENAFIWFRLAGENGNAAMQKEVGDCYYHGRGVSQDFAEGVRWYFMAAEKGCSAAQKELGLCYKCGMSVPQDDDKAARWFEKAASQGDSEAQKYLSECYASGLGVSKDKSEAIRWKNLSEGRQESTFGKLFSRKSPRRGNQ